jgi:hypothetical protein
MMGGGSLLTLTCIPSYYSSFLLLSTHPSLLRILIFQPKEIYKWARGAAASGDRVEDTMRTTQLSCCGAEFETPLKSDFNFNFNVALSTTLL